LDNFIKNKFFIFLTVVALFLLGFMLYAFTNEGGTVIDNTAGTVVSPAQNGAGGILGFGRNIVERLTQYGKVKAENEALKQKNAQYETDNAKNEAYKAENEQLKGLLGIKEANPDFNFEQAVVVAKDPGDWFSVFTIDKGTLHGVKTGCPVITSDGLVGRVKEVGLVWAKVVSIIDSDCVVGAIVVRTTDAAVLEGDLELSKKGLCKMNYIDNATNINRGDIIDTSGLGGIFPKGLRIGRIEDIKPEPHGISQYAVIRPAVDFNKLRKVMVIKSFNGQLTNEK
jgi:rod shape-determining protein MreC